MKESLSRPRVIPLTSLQNSSRSFIRFFLAGVVLFLIGVLPGASWAHSGKRLESKVDLSEEIKPGYGTDDENIVLAFRRRHGRHHPLHHGMGRAGSGVCPQTRTIVQAPDSIDKLKNPLPASRENIDVGEGLYQTDAEPTACKVCHGENGNGIGMMAQGLAAMPRNFTCAETMKKVTDGQMYWVIKNGSPTGGMPPYKFLEENQIWQLIHYLRRFAQ
ncbi:MAG: c-type cytochrome [Nitrospinales bacterium]